MAISFPASLANFFNLLPINSGALELMENYEAEETGNGEILTADLGQRLWEMSVTIRKGSYDEIEDVRALLNVFRAAGASFFAFPIPRNFPRFDPTGSILGSNVPKLHTVNANNRDIRLSSLPNGYRIARGDFLSFSYGANPTRHALHQVVNSVVAADSSGLTPLFEVRPAIRPGFTLNSNVKLTKPEFKAFIVPGSGNLGTSSQQQTSGVSFTIRQTLGR